jgi:hypothetical protein
MRALRCGGAIKPVRGLKRRPASDKSLGMVTPDELRRKRIGYERDRSFIAIPAAVAPDRIAPLKPKPPAKDEAR